MNSKYTEDLTNEENNSSHEELLNICKDLSKSHKEHMNRCAKLSDSYQNMQTEMKKLLDAIKNFNNNAVTSSKTRE